MNIIIVGAGLIGAALGYELARRGAGVTVLARDRPERAASWAALGLLAPSMIPDPAGRAWLDLAQASLLRYPAWVADLEAQSGVDVGLRRSGFMEVALVEGTGELEEEAEFQSGAGVRVEWLSGKEAQWREPLLAPEVSGALFYPDSMAVDNRRLSSAALIAAQAAGASLEYGVGVGRLILDGAGAVVGVGDGQREWRGDAVVNAAGAWSTTLDLQRAGQVRPVRGQALRLQPRGPLPGTVLSWCHNYLVPREGAVLVGATIEDAGYETGVTADGLNEMLGKTLRMAPSLGRAGVVECWSGLRPGTPDGLPLIGADPHRPRLFYATGHYRNGILLAPITVAAVAAMVTGDVPPLTLEPFSPGRFPFGTAG